MIITNLSDRYFTYTSRHKRRRLKTPPLREYLTLKVDTQLGGDTKTVELAALAARARVTTDSQNVDHTLAK